MTEEKNCAFQFATAPRWGNVRIIEDVTEITFKEAKELFNKYLPEFRKALQNEQRPEMGIWVNMKNPTDYRESFMHLTYDYETDGTKLWITKKEYVTELK